MNNRLDELIIDDLPIKNHISVTIEDDQVSETSTMLKNQALNEVHKEFEIIEYQINQILLNSEDIKHLEMRASIEASYEQQQIIMQKLDDTISMTMNIGKIVKQELLNWKIKVDEYDLQHPHSTISQWKKK